MTVSCHGQRQLWRVIFVLFVVLVFAPAVPAQEQVRIGGCVKRFFVEDGSIRSSLVQQAKINSARLIVPTFGCRPETNPHAGSACHTKCLNVAHC